ncbi:MAG: hypothetical protein ABIJ91_01725 [Candidatus Kuenenbacteria bacterium]
MIKPIKTRLEKEIVYLKNFAMSRRYDQDGFLSAENFYKNNIDNLREMNLTKKKEDFLRKSLEKYNSIKLPQKKQINYVSREIANDLKLLGYRV